MNEAEWLAIAARNPAFEFLKNKEEDIYSIKGACASGPDEIDSVS